MKNIQKDTNNQTNKESLLRGFISINAKGTGFFIPKETETDSRLTSQKKRAKKRDQGTENSIEITPDDLHTALHHDEVEIRLLGKKSRFDREMAEVVTIIARYKMRFTGVLEEVSGGFACIPDDTRFYKDIFIKPANAKNGVTGDKVFIEIIEWDEKKGYPEGSVIEIIGKKGEHNAEMRAIVLEKGLAYDFPEGVVAEAHVLEQNKTITTEEISKRRDFRGVLTCTIDPVDAKDFDDAISFLKIETGPHAGMFEIGVHIADVSHYVQEGTALDKEARERGFSVYLVDRTIPMLPEILSNDVCSLNPHQDKLVFSAVFIMDANAQIHDKWFGKGIINSDRRFAYEEAQEVIEGVRDEYSFEIKTLNDIAKKLRTEKEAKGAIDFETDEIKFELDATGKPIRVFRKVRKDAHKMVEEFMLLANREVAYFMWEAHEKNKGAFLYRIHDVPVTEKIEDLALYVKALGYSLPIQKNGVTVKDLKKLFSDIAGSEYEPLIKTAAIRSMAKAVYSTQNIGHYGLAFEYYTHFTSPIRRYADLIVHRLLFRELTSGKISAGEATFFQKIAEENSEKEVRAAEAERASIKYKQVEYMLDRVGQSFVGIITGVTEWGFFIEEKETKAEGMIRAVSLGDDYYVFDPKKYALVGEKTKKVYRLGQEVTFKIVAADMERKTLDYALVA